MPNTAPAIINSQDYFPPRCITHEEYMKSDSYVLSNIYKWVKYADKVGVPRSQIIKMLRKNIQKKERNGN